MREKKKFGKITDAKRRLPNDDAIKDTFGVVNSGYDSMQIVDFIKKTTGHKINIGGEDLCQCGKNLKIKI